MITQIKQIQILNGISPFNYIFTSTSECITFPSFTFDEDDSILTLTIEATDEACIIANPTITINVSDSNQPVNCTQSITLNLVNPCNDFTVTSITENNLTFSVSSISNCSGARSYNWEYSDSFNLISQVDGNTSSSITLDIDSNISSEELIAVEVTDCNGCSERVEYIYSICAPEVGNSFLDAYCTSETVWTTGFYSIVVNESCAGIDYSTLTVNTPVGVSYGIDSRGYVQFTFDNPRQAIYNLEYTVRDNNGILSNTGILTVAINDCGIEQVYGDFTISNVPQGATPGDIVSNPISDRVIGRNTIDWGTFTILPNIPFTSPDISLRGGLDGRQYIDYEVPNPPVTESMQFTVEDINGNRSKAITQTFVYHTDTFQLNPVTACVVSGQQVVTDFTANDLGTLDESSFRIISAPSTGTYTVNGTTVTYDTQLGVSGDQVFTYEIEDVYGNKDTETVTYTLTYPGVSNTFTVCTDRVYNFYEEFLNSSADTGGTWVATSGGGPVPASWNSDVDLSGQYGSFVYEYNVIDGICASKSIITINKQITPDLNNDECINADSLTALTTLPYSDSNTTQMQEECNIHQAATLSVEALPAHWSTVESDMWIDVDISAITANPNPITVTINTTNAGLLNPGEFAQIAVYSSCGGTEYTAVNNVFRNNSDSTFVIPNGSIPGTLIIRIGSNNPGNFKTTVTITE